MPRFVAGGPPKITVLEETRYPWRGKFEASEGKLLSMSGTGLTGQQAFARLIETLMASGKANKKVAASRGKGKRWRYPELGDKAVLSASTIRKWIAEGKKPTDDNIVKVLRVFFEEEEVSGHKDCVEIELVWKYVNFWDVEIKSDENKAESVSINNDENHPLAGRYFMLRQTFDAPSYFGLYDISFIYNNQKQRLEFRNTARSEFESTSIVTKPKDSPHIEIVDVRPDGFNSLTICTVPDEEGYVYGVIFTMGLFSRNAHLPSIAPVVFFPFNENVRIGLVSPDDHRYGAYASLIARSRDPMFFKLIDMVSFNGGV